MISLDGLMLPLLIYKKKEAIKKAKELIGNNWKER